MFLLFWELTRLTSLKYNNIHKGGSNEQQHILTIIKSRVLLAVHLLIAVTWNVGSINWLLINHFKDLCLIDININEQCKIDS